VVAQAINARPIRPFEPVMMIRVIESWSQESETR
jgi:hypothetical protein